MPCDGVGAARSPALKTSEAEVKRHANIFTVSRRGNPIAEWEFVEFQELAVWKIQQGLVSNQETSCGRWRGNTPKRERLVGS